MKSFHLSNIVQTSGACFCDVCRPFYVPINKFPFTDMAADELFHKNNNDNCLFNIIEKYHYLQKNKDLFIIDFLPMNIMADNISYDLDITMSQRSLLSLNTFDNPEGILTKKLIDDFFLLQRYCYKFNDTRALNDIWEYFAEKNYLIKYNIGNYHHLDKKLSYMNIPVQNLANINNFTDINYIINPVSNINKR